MDGDSHWANQAALILAGLALLVALSGRIWVGPSNPTGPQAGHSHLRADKAELQATLEQLRKGIRPQFRVPGKPVLPMVPSAPSPKLLPAAPLLPGGPATLVIPPG